MKSNYRIFTAVFLSAVLTATAPLTVCGAEVFSAGESFSDETGKCFLQCFTQNVSVMERGVFLPY